MVALLAEGVDRNLSMAALVDTYKVALLAEGVDRNRFVLAGPFQLQVALLAEGVDRNLRPALDFSQQIMSPSSRRAWIEI